MGRACPPLLPSARVRAGGPVEGGVWSGRDVAADVKSQDWPGDQDQAAFLSLGSGVVQREFGDWMQCEVGRSAGPGPALGAPRPGAQARGAGDLDFWTSGERRPGGQPPGWRAQIWGWGTGGPPRDPVDLLTWRLCSAASSSRCRFAQTSRCSGKVGPGPAMLGLSAASWEGGRAGAAGAAQYPLGLGTWRRPLASSPRRAGAAPTAAPAPPAAVAAAAAQAAGRGGPAGGAVPGRGGASGLVPALLRSHRNLGGAGARRGRARGAAKQRCRPRAPGQKPGPGSQPRVLAGKGLRRAFRGAGPGCS